MMKQGVGNVAEWIRVPEASEMKVGEARRFVLHNQRVALFRLADGYFAIGDRCSHAEASLAESEVDAEAGEVACHRHGARFDIRTGKNLSLPATRPVPRFPVRMVDGAVEVHVE